MTNWVIDPPVWSLVLLIVAGLFLIYWDARRNHLSVAADQDKPPTASASIARRISATQVHPHIRRMKGEVRHNLYTQGGEVLVGLKGKAFTLHFSVASRDRAHVYKGTLQYLARVRGKNKGDRLTIEEYPESSSFVIATGERFLAVNNTGYLIQGLIVTVKDDRYDEYDEIVFKYCIIPVRRETVAI